MNFLIIYIVGLVVAVPFLGYVNAKNLHDICPEDDWDAETVIFGIFTGAFAGAFWPITMPVYGFVKAVVWITNNKPDPLNRLRKLKAR